MLKDFVEGLVAERLPKIREKITYYDNLKRGDRSARKKLSINDMLVEVNDFLGEHSGYDVFAESGDMLFGGLEVCPQKGGLYYAQGYYASMGFGIPAALGVQIGTGRRPLILCGDGGFQMTGSEISHAPRLGLSPIVVLVNNAGWGIFRPVTPKQELLDLPPWPFAELAESWGGVGIRVTTPAELKAALREAHATKGFVIVECIVSKEDASPMGRRYIRKSARKGSD
jgi:indolepyruvate decarboxylase